MHIGVKDHPSRLYHQSQRNPPISLIFALRESDGGGGPVAEERPERRAGSCSLVCNHDRADTRLYLSMVTRICCVPEKTPADLFSDVLRMIPRGASMT